MVKIPLLINALIVALSAGLGLWESNRPLCNNQEESLEFIQKKRIISMPSCPLMVLLFIISLYLQKHPHMMWNFLIWLQYWLGTVVWGLIMVMIVFLFSLVSSVAFKTRHKEKCKAISACVLFIILLEASLWIFTKPATPNLYDRISRDGFIMQTDAATCLAASVANVIKTFGIVKSEKDIAELLGTSYLLGTSLA